MIVVPEVVIRPILPVSVNQSAPSGPETIPCGSVPGVGSGYSVITPDVVIRPMALPAPVVLLDSVNQRAPSGPLAIPTAAVGGEYSVITPAVVTRPMPPKVNQSAPSGPAAISDTVRPWSTGPNAVATHAVVICQISKPVPRPTRTIAANHNAPSDPEVIALTLTPPSSFSTTGYSLIATATIF